MKKTITTDYLCYVYNVAKDASEVMNSIKDSISHDLYDKMYNSLLGFEADLQVCIALSIRDAVRMGWEKYTYLHHVDEMLKNFYLAIDKELDRI